MKEDNSIKISLSTAFLIIAVILICIMGFGMYKMYNQIGVLSNEIIELEKIKNTSPIPEVSKVKEDNELNTINSNDISSNKIKENNKVTTNEHINNTPKEENNNYKKRSEILSEYEKSTEELERKYAVTDINEDGYEDLVIYNQKELLVFDVNVYFGTKDGLYLAGTPIKDAHPSHTGIIKEKDKNYLTIIYGHMGYETISYAYFNENGMEIKKILDHEIDPEQGYESEKLVDTLKWENI